MQENVSGMICNVRGFSLECIGNKLLIKAVYHKKIDNKELQTVSWQWNDSPIYGYGVKEGRYKYDLTEMRDTGKTYEVTSEWSVIDGESINDELSVTETVDTRDSIQYWGNTESEALNAELYNEKSYRYEMSDTSITDKYNFIFKNYYDDGSLIVYEFEYNISDCTIQFKNVSSDLFPLSSVEAAIKDEHQFDGWAMGTCSNTEDIYVKDLSSYTIGLYFENVSAYTLDQVTKYRVSIDQKEPVTKIRYNPEPDGRMKLDLLPYYKGLGITEGSLITVWAITVNGYAIKVFEGLTNGGEQSIQSNENGYAYDSSIGYSNPNWVGKINGERTISEVSFAGTHGSIALHGVTPFDEDWVRNQRMTITTQLNSGIRYFDIRARRTQNSFAMHHGSVFQKLMFGDVLDAMALFLRQNPYETILMRLKEEHDPETGSASFETILTRYWNLYNSYFWDPKSSNPKLKDVRGKIIIIQNFSASKSFGISYNSLVIQDHDNVDDAPDAMYDKWNRVKSHLQSANNSNKTQIYLNHLSGNGGYNGAKPWFVSSGYNSRGTDSIKKLIQESNSSKWPDYPRGYYGQVFYGGTNLLTKEFIPRLGLQHVGIIAADFPGKGLIDTVVKLNGRLSTSDIQYVRLNANKEIEVGFTGDVYVRKHYQIKRNGSYIASLENGTAYYSYWQQTSFGHQLTRKGITLFTGDKIQVYLVDGGKETLLATLTVEIKEEELEIIQVPDGPYKIISELNKSSVVDLSKTSSQNVALWAYNNQLEGEWDFKYDSTQKAYRIYNRWNSSLVMARNAYDEGINVFGTPYEGKPEHLWIIRRTGDNDGTVYLQNKKDETKQLMLDVQAGGTSNGTNINIWPLNRLKQQKFKLVARRETLESQIDSSYRPLSGQKNRSSSNFSLGHLADGTRVRVSIEGAGSVNLSFRVMRDKPADTDPTIWSDVKNGSILTVQSGANKKDLYIANPSGYSSNGTFKVKFYTLQN